MQTIYKASHTSRFNFIGSDLCNSPMPMSAKAVLLYLIDKPTNWKLIVKNISNTLQMSTYAVRQGLRWLIDHGYASYQRLSDGRTIWQIFEQPKQAATPVMTPRVEIPHVEIEHDIHITQTSPITQKATTPIDTAQAHQEPMPIETHNVVVEKELINQKGVAKPDTLEEFASTKTADKQQVIAGIPDKHQRTARQALRTLTKEEADSVVTALTLAMSKGTVSNPVGYMLQLVKASKNGTFSPVQAAGAAPAITLDERLRRERERQEEAQQRGAMNSTEHAAWLEKNFGARPVDAGKAGSRGVSLRSMLGWS